MSKRASGWVVAVFILGAIATFLALNIDTRPSRVTKPGKASRDDVAKPAQPVVNITPAGFREYPIGDEAEQNHLRIAAVWLPAVHLAGEPASADDVIHLEADVRSTEGNPNGFAKDEFVPYLVIRYTIQPAKGGDPMSGEMVPMVARDGLHYGASIQMPGPGEYKLTYAVEPPSSGGLGRHDDPATGVAPWWKPFRVSYDWDYEPVSHPGQ
jgi:uncharacterized protein involved in high-affinity Fe2+ transport